MKSDMKITAFSGLPNNKPTNEKPKGTEERQFTSTLNSNDDTSSNDSSTSLLSLLQNLDYVEQQPRFVQEPEWQNSDEDNIDSSTETRDVDEYYDDSPYSSDPYSNDFNDGDAAYLETAQASKDLKHQLIEAKTQLRNEIITEDAAIESAAEGLVSHDGQVQTAALELLAETGPNEDTIDPLLRAIHITVDTDVVTLAMKELERQTKEISGHGSKIDKSLQHTIKEGNFSTTPTVARNIMPFVNDGNRGNYVQLLQGLGSDHLAHSALNDYLGESSMQYTGG